MSQGFRGIKKPSKGEGRRLDGSEPAASIDCVRVRSVATTFLVFAAFGLYAGQKSTRQSTENPGLSRIALSGPFALCYSERSDLSSFPARGWLREESSLAAGTVPGFSTDTFQRLVVLAPHPDDEILGCGGLMQRALAQGDSVWVVYLTSGDASWTSAAWCNRTLLVGPTEYLGLGKRRMDEARAGAAALGLSADCLTFLGFPDQGLAQLWCEHWDAPFSSLTTGVNHSPYENRRVYSGRSLLQDLANLLYRQRPDCILCPHPTDAHPDHWATATFTVLVRSLWPDTVQPAPRLLYYAPIHGDATPEGHLVVHLNPTELGRKFEALDCHKTQVEIPGNRLDELCREYELFDTSGPKSSPVVRNSPRTRLLPSTLVDTLAIILTDSCPLVRLVLQAEPCPAFDYRLLIHAVVWPRCSARHRTAALELAADNEPLLTRQEPSSTLADSIQVQPSRSGWEVALPRSWFGSPMMVFYLVEVRWRGILLNHSDLGQTTLGTWEKNRD